MNDIEAALRAELRAEHYELVTSVPMADTVRRRVRLRRRLRYASAAGATVLAVGAVLGLVVLRPAPGQQVSVPPPSTAVNPTSSGPPVGDPAGPGTATTPPTSAPPAQVGNLPVKGVPAYLAATDPAAAVAGAPGLAVRPTGGQQAAFTRGTRPGAVDRVVVALDFTEPLGLPGSPVTLDWSSADGMRQLQILTTDDSATQTTYLQAWSPTGRRWFLAVTGPDADARRTVLQDVARQTMSGT
jgi:hypothetical protein